MQSAFLGCEAGRDGSSLLTLVNTYIFMNNIVNLLFGGTNMIFLGPSKHCSFSRSLCVCQEMDSNRSKCTTTPFLIISSLKPTSKITGKLKKKTKPTNQESPWWSSGQDSEFSLLGPGSIADRGTKILQATLGQKKKSKQLY